MSKGEKKKKEKRREEKRREEDVVARVKLDFGETHKRDGDGRACVRG